MGSARQGCCSRDPDSISSSHQHCHLPVVIKWCLNWIQKSHCEQPTWQGGRLWELEGPQRLPLPGPWSPWEPWTPWAPRVRAPDFPPEAWSPLRSLPGTLGPAPQPHEAREHGSSRARTARAQTLLALLPATGRAPSISSSTVGTTTTGGPGASAAAWAYYWQVRFLVCRCRKDGWNPQLPSQPETSLGETEKLDSHFSLARNSWMRGGGGRLLGRPDLAASMV